MPKKLLAALVVVALAGAAVAAARRSSRTEEHAFRSQAIAGALSYRVFLPPGYYDSGDRRYPVVYFLHGLPSGPHGYRGAGFVASALARAGEPALLVSPQGARASEPDPEYLDRGPGRRWETAITRELVREIDARYRTVAARRGRALVGISAGGYGAMLLGLHHLDEYAVVESWSGYFHPTDPSGLRALELGSSAADRRASAHTFVPVLRARLRRHPTLIAFYVGRGDDRFADENEQLDRELRAAQVPHVFREYPGGHEQAVWNAHATGWLELALRRLAQG